METFTVFSEKYNKYLLGFLYNGIQYFVVWGTDIDEDGKDKFIIDESDNIVLFSSKKNLRDYLNDHKSNFDQNNFSKWLFHISDESLPYAIINFDRIYRIKTIQDTVVIKEIFFLLGLFEDYSGQVSNQVLSNILNKNEIRKFMDLCADYFIWKESKDLKLINKKSLIKSLNEIFEIIKNKLIII